MGFWNSLGKMFTRVVFGIPINGVTSLASTAFGILMFVLRLILELLVLIFTKVLPFMLIYLGVPLFVLGLIFGFMFVGGQMLLFVILIGGTYYAIKYLFTNNFKVKDILNNNSKNKSNQIKIKAP
jgi:hypothetical protein